MDRTMLPIAPFMAEYLHASDNDEPGEWRPCQVVGIYPSDDVTAAPGFIAIAHHSGKTFPVEVREVRKVRT